VILQDFHTHQSNLDESSGYSLAGSFTRDLTASKVWLLSELEKIQTNYSTIYMLGSWYGNLALYMTLEGRTQADKIVLVEKDKKFLSTSKKLLNLSGADNIEYMLEDSNKLGYRQLGDAGCVINTSLTDMQGRAWFLNIPSGTLVVMQGRDHDPNRSFSSTQDIIDRFPLSEVLYHGRMQLRDPETQYTRYMVIGRK
jgi:hypothetical protein